MMDKGQQEDAKVSASINDYASSLGDNVEEERFRSPVTNDQLLDMKNAVKKLMEPGKGILAIDEMDANAKDKILEALMTIGTLKKRRDPVLAFIEGCKEIGDDVSGILFHEANLTPLVGKTRAMVIRKFLGEALFCLGAREGTEVQTLAGTNGEMTSSGLDALPEKCARLKAWGVVFLECPYRLTLGDEAPSFLACHQNAMTAARFASICQSFGLVAMISIEIQEGSIANDFDLNRALNILREILVGLVKVLSDHHVCLEAVILRLSPLWVPPSALKSPNRTTFQQLATATWVATMRTLPAAIGGIAVADDVTMDASTKGLNELQLCPCLKPFPVTYCWGHVFSEQVPPWLSDTNSRNKQSLDLEILEWLKKKLKVCSLATMGQLSQTSGSLFVTCISSFC